MRKQFGWFIVPGVLCATIFRDRGPGYILAFVYGIILGIPLYALVYSILKILRCGKREVSRIIATSITSIVIFLIFWLIYYPPASILFKRLVANPIPVSVCNFKSASSIDGPTDCSHYIKFNINVDELNKIIENKELISASVTVKQVNRIQIFELTSSDGSVFSIPVDISWFALDSFENAKAFIMNREDYFSEYVFYEPDAQEALYLYYN